MSEQTLETVSGVLEPWLRALGHSPETSQVPRSANPPVRLTPRQHAVLRLVRRGLSNKLIARELGLAEGTVKIHISAILRELNVRNRTEAAVWHHGGQGA